MIVNTARGAVMDESALVEALNSGKVFSCGLDVYEDEPKVHPGLIANPHVMLVPHMGTWTVEVCNTPTQKHYTSVVVSLLLVLLSSTRERTLIDFAHDHTHKDTNGNGSLEYQQCSKCS